MRKQRWTSIRNLVQKAHKIGTEKANGTLFQKWKKKTMLFDVITHLFQCTNVEIIAAGDVDTL